MRRWSWKETLSCLMRSKRAPWTRGRFPGPLGVEVPDGVKGADSAGATEDEADSDSTALRFLAGSPSDEEEEDEGVAERRRLVPAAVFLGEAVDGEEEELEDDDELDDDELEEDELEEDEEEEEDELEDELSLSLPSSGRVSLPLLAALGFSSSFSSSSSLSESESLSELELELDESESLSDEELELDEELESESESDEELSLSGKGMLAGSTDFTVLTVTVASGTG